MDSCPVCDSREYAVTVRRRGIPAMQNYVHRTREAALAAKRGDLELRLCRRCGFGWNGAFDPGLLDYDQGYDNSVPSGVMDAYYDSLADNLYDRFSLGGRLTIDVGCGKGTFLRRLARRRPDIRGLGVDPSFESEPGDDALPLSWETDIFRPEQVEEPPALVLCRHVIEHIPRPVDFLASIRAGIDRYPGTPGFFEAPDLGWIVAHDAFWDFCYEHCNYFSPASLRYALVRAGFDVDRVETGFGAQYLHAYVRGGVGALDAERTEKAAAEVEELIKECERYVAREERRRREAEDHLDRERARSRTTVVWGMATKGILYANLVDPEAKSIDVCVDVNERKQGAFVPVTGHRIEAPEALSVFRDREKLVVTVMNTNYAGEIAKQLHAMLLDAGVFDANGELLKEIGRYEFD